MEEIKLTRKISILMIIIGLLLSMFVAIEAFSTSDIHVVIRSFSLLIVSFFIVILPGLSLFTSNRITIWVQIILLGLLALSIFFYAIPLRIKDPLKFLQATFPALIFFGAIIVSNFFAFKFLRTNALKYLVFSTLLPLSGTLLALLIKGELYFFAIY